jgi:hypothetical protein
MLYPLYKRVGGHQGRSRLVQKNPFPAGFDYRTVQLVAILYTDCAIFNLVFFGNTNLFENNAQILLRNNIIGFLEALNLVKRN